MRCYLVRQIDGPYLSRDDSWIGSKPESRLVQFTHRDEALNRIVELSVQNPDLRLTLVEATRNERDRLCLPDEAHFHCTPIALQIGEAAAVEELPAA